MKKLVFAFIVVGLWSCNKKKEEPKETPVPTPVVPARINSMSATVNGTSWTVMGHQTSNANIEQSAYNGNPKQYVIAGRTDPSLNKNSIHLGFSYKLGTSDLESFTNFYALYYDSTGTSYPVKTGTIHIAALDTSHKKSSATDKLQATFSFVTSSILGSSYTVTNGSIDFEAK